MALNKKIVNITSSAGPHIRMNARTEVNAFLPPGEYRALPENGQPQPAGGYSAATAERARAPCR
ncbi:MAG: hypothetical protein GYA12_04965, partial [Chloroflexi bacterium]|nr:hypothetical protein [Chloroflexota bacterium]